MSYNLHLSFELTSQIYELTHQLYDLEKMMPVDPLMLRVTKKIQVDKNITTWPKYYELAIILRVNESTDSRGKRKVWKIYTNCQIFEDSLKMSILCYFQSGCVLLWKEYFGL